ncbi:serine/threonine protein phosphatase [Natrarchaeobius halalkaliphilus]|uniref:Serine/threonine protein phosphatase n=1 Tax=Natrarchaeobius halalkaliphilus TaxID=1679091 RepID=A0A3N6LZW1_9EURY|nr:metallophosphoesterase [Natrarchaeobius halalkaliphilus]RQG87774.1 serine/threonine protein phosphatase [Natrarchaeobius halalkaliphilus]
MTVHDSDTQGDQSSPGQDSDVLRVPIVGDLEPKPDPVFDNFESAIDAINRLAEDRSFDFVAGIGDVAHKGTRVQYEAATEILQDLEAPFYPILGNEELEESTDRFFEYAKTWNDDPSAIPDISYVKTANDVLFVFATASKNGKDFDEEELDWIESKLEAHEDLPAVLFVHAAPQNVFPEGRTMQTANFDRILSMPNVSAVFSGHSHMSVHETTTYARDEWENHHVHIPGIERTKVGDDHVPRFRIATIASDGRTTVETYNVDEDQFEDEHEVTFQLKRVAVESNGD